MKRIALVVLIWLVFLTNVQAESNAENCLIHTWKAAVGKTSAMMKFDYTVATHTLYGEYYFPTSPDEIILKNDENEKNLWKEIDHKSRLIGLLTLSCVGNALSGEWKSPDGKVALPIQARVASASFDCTKANSRIEKMICGNPELSALDFKMDFFYKADLTRNSTNKADQLKTNQKDWIKKARSICDDESCLRQVYDYRIFELSSQGYYRKAKTPNIRIEGVTVAVPDQWAFRIGGDQNQRNKSFNANLDKKSEGKITQCNILIDLPAGVRDGNHSYGGICTLSKNGQKSKVMICDDEMVGHFKMDTINHDVTKQELVDFVVSNCFGG